MYMVDRTTQMRGGRPWARNTSVTEASRRPQLAQNMPMSVGPGGQSALS